MGIILNTFNGGSLTPKSDGKIFEKATPINGIISGCALSHLGTNQVQVTAGMGIIKGRRFEVTLETLQVALATSGTMNGRIYVRMNLSDSVTPIKFLSVCATTLPALTQDANINDTNGIWEMELATYSATTTVISGLTTTYLTVKKSLTENSIVNTNTATEAGTVADGRQLNETIEGTLANKVSKLSNYSTTEQVGGLWHDGKPWYFKTISLGAMPNATTKNVAHGISNLKFMIEMVGGAESPTGNIGHTLPYSSSAASANCISLNNDNTNIIIVTGVNYSSLTDSWLTVRYTKTTD